MVRGIIAINTAKMSNILILAIFICGNNIFRRGYSLRIKRRQKYLPQQAVATIPQNKPKNKPRQLTSKKDVVLEAIQKADGLTKEELQKITGLTFGQVSYALLLLRESGKIVGQHLKNHQKKYFRNEKHK